MSGQYSVTILMTKAEAAKSKSKTKERTLTFHHTSVTSSRPVVNAMSGYPYPFNMGSKDMFRCYMTTTTIHPPKTRPRKPPLTARRTRQAAAATVLDPAARRALDSKDEKELVRLYYDSPDQYEEHTGWKASVASIKKWEKIQREISGGYVTSNGKTYLFNKL